jgi:hypothetical protein
MIAARDAAGQPIVRDPSSVYINVVGLGDMLIEAGQVVRGRRLLEAILYYAELEPSFAPRRKAARFQAMFAALRQHAAAERAAVVRL